MISYNFFKLFEYCLLPFIKELPICSAQFGYRSGASTILATALLKETIGCNIEDGSSVYSCFLDMSKAFERVNHDLLLSKLANMGLPTHFVRIFKYVYAQIAVKVRVNESFSDSWRICRGVRQGGITSAFLFNIYIDDILSSISNFKVGCFLGFKRVNIQTYADDIVLLSLTVS